MAVRLVALPLAVEQQPEILAVQPVLGNVLAREGHPREIGCDGHVRDLQLSLETEERSAHAARDAASDLEGHAVGIGRAVNAARGESRLIGQHDKQQHYLSTHRFLYLANRVLHSTIRPARLNAGNECAL